MQRPHFGLVVVAFSVSMLYSLPVLSLIFCLKLQMNVFLTGNDLADSKVLVTRDVTHVPVTQFPDELTRKLSIVVANCQQVKV